jgi:hypothetical protein
MSSNQNQRPRFFEGQYLGAEDLSAAVDYSRIQMARHALGAHTWGIATGLQLNEKTLAGGQIEVYVLPGYAWDGFGRTIVILAPYKIPTELFKSNVFDPAIDNGTPEGRLIKVWLRYDEGRAQNVRPGFEVCDTEDQRSRVQETFQVEVGARPNHIDRHDRITVAGNSIDAQEVIQKFDPQTSPVSLFDESVPFQDLPDSDTKARWLILLGYVRWKPNPDPNQPGKFIKRSDEDLKASRRLRRYIGVVAESVQAADGVLRMRDRTKNCSSVQSDDLVWVEGNLRVEGDVRPFGGKLDFRHADGQDFDVPLKVQRIGDPGPGNRALEVIIGPDSQTNNRFAVGPLKKDGTVNEKFVVLSGGNIGIGTVTPDRALTIQGSAGTYLNVKADGGTHEVLLGADGNGGIVSTMTNHDLQLRAGGNTTRMVIKADGNVGIGTTTPVSPLQVAGDVSIQRQASGIARNLPSGATMFWNDGTWLRLNQNVDFSKPIFGVHTPGLFAPGSLNVGGAGNWGDPGVGNVWITGNVGIGTTAPATKLHVLGNRIRLENSNKHVDIRADGSAVDLHSETNHLYVRSSGPGGNNNVIINPFGTDGNVGIGTEAPSDKLHLIGDLRISGTARKPGGGSWTNSSDARLKKNIEPLVDALSKLLQLRGVRFEWQEPEKMGNLIGPQLGLVAQEVEKVFPEWVSTGPDGYRELTIRGFEALTIEALRELRAEIESLREKLEQK